MATFQGDTGRGHIAGGYGVWPHCRGIRGVTTFQGDTGCGHIAGGYGVWPHFRGIRGVATFQGQYRRPGLISEVQIRELTVYYSNH